MSTAIDFETYSPPKQKKLIADAPPKAFSPKKKQLAYYDFGPVCSYNAAYNFIVGGRGLGKTYGAKKYVINRFLKKHEMFIYMRRHETEMKNMDTFFMDIQWEYPQWDFRVNGRRFECSPASARDDKKRQWEVMGYAIPLSTAQKHKSIPYPEVTTIIFDEFIIEKGVVHYLGADEARVFNNFYNTVDRWDDRTKVFFLANAVTIANPYFTALKILPTDDENEFLRDPEPERFWIAHFPNAAEFTNQVYETRFGKFIQGTEYAEYAVGNQFSDNHNGLVALKNERAKHQFNLETQTGTFSWWYDVIDDTYYCLRSHIPTGQMTLTTMPDRMSESKFLLSTNDLLFKKMQHSYKAKKVRFDDAGTRNIFILEMKP